MKYLVIVESPAKCKKIESYLGKDFIVRASFGHIRNLSPKSLSVDLSNNYKPSYTIMDSKKQIVKELVRLTNAAGKIILATDKDREGEAIAWHLLVCLKSKTSKLDKDFCRVTFNSITKETIIDAFKDLTQTIDLPMVRAQEARRVLDRLLGYGMCGVMSQCIVADKKLTAGRVQSVVADMIRRKEIHRKESITKILDSVYNFKGTGIFKEFPETATVQKIFKKEVDVKQYLTDTINSKPFTILSLIKYKKSTIPPPPYITSTLQIAAQKQSIGAKQTMQLAQKLYEAGLITYMRTDAHNISQPAIKEIKGYVIKEFGSNYSAPRLWSLKTSNSTTSKPKAQEAHECIRVTDPSKTKVSGKLTIMHQKLYTMIWKRTIASQMSSESISETTASIEHHLQVKFNEQLFDGYKIIYTSTDTVKPIIIPSVGQTLTMKSITITESIPSPPPLYNEGTLVRDLEMFGVGRPSTYANMVTLVQERGYVQNCCLKSSDNLVTSCITFKVTAKTNIKRGVKKLELGKQKGRVLRITPNGIIVLDFLDKWFGAIVTPKFTTVMEKRLDDISKKTSTYDKVVDQCYGVYKSQIKKIETSDITINSIKKPTETLGEYKGMDIILKDGKYGPYIVWNGNNYSIENKCSISLEMCIKEIENKEKIIKLVHKKKTIYVKPSKFGDNYYIQGTVNGKLKNFPLSIDTDINKLTGENLYRILHGK